MSFDLGRYQWTQLPISTNVTSNVFQKKLDEIFQNIQCITGIVDDMIIYGKSQEEHDVHFLNFPSIMRKNNLWLNALKLQFQLEEESFFGHKWNSKGISPDPKKIHAIKQMVFPPDKESMQSFLGMISFLNRYSPRLAELTTTLRELCRIHADYKPKSEHHKSFYAIKRDSLWTLYCHITILPHTPHFKLIVPRKDLELYLSKMVLQSILQAEQSQLQKPTIRILNEKHSLQYGVWKNFITFCMAMNSH